MNESGGSISITVLNRFGWWTMFKIGYRVGRMVRSAEALLESAPSSHPEPLQVPVGPADEKTSPEAGRLDFLEGCDGKHE